MFSKPHISLCYIFFVENIVRSFRACCGEDDGFAIVIRIII